ncbi:MAG: M48 family metalloprotease [Crocinitomicaceae bacterium]|nr:M48 family metallopeptidase [Flavobacteriales bacterium]NQZ36726.1 M48 family metalloprotease [Crocinitomicaceae bacterium]
MRLFLSILLCLPISVFAQNNELDQFYNSNYEPSELNTDFTSRFDSIYNAYLSKKNITQDKSGVLKDFVLNYNYFLDKLNKSGEIFYNNEISIYLNELKDTLLYNHPLKNDIKVYLTNFSELNAFTNDFGNIYVNVGLIAKMNSVDELLTVLAHEISHVLLEHSYKQENRNIDLENGREISEVDEIDVFESHKFSRGQELEADSLAIELLQNNGFNLSAFESSFELLRHSKNPIYTGSPDLNLLFFGDYESITYFDGIQDVVNLYDLNFELDSAELSAITDTLLMTHPTIDQRIKNIKTLVDSTLVYESFKSQNDFNLIKLLASKVYLKKLSDERNYIEGIYLAVKLRELYPNDNFLTKTQLKLMLLLTQSKYKPRYSNQILNEFGNECNSEDYLKFRWAMLQIPALEMNILTIQSIKKSTSTDPYLKRLDMFANQFLYKNNRYLFITTSTGISVKPDLNMEQGRVLDLSEYYTTVEVKQYNKNKKIGYQYVHQVLPSDNLVTTFLSEHFDAISFSEQVSQYKLRRNDFGKGLTLDQFALTIDPKDFTKISPKGNFVSSISYSDSAQVVLAQSHTYSVIFDKKSAKMDILETAESNELISRIMKEENIYDAFQTNQVNSKSNLTVKENYRHYVLNQYINDCWNLSDLTYSSVDEEIQKITTEQKLDYASYNLNFIFHNRTKNKNFSVHYNLFFDLRNMGVVYFSKIPSRSRPSDLILRRIFKASKQGRKK